MNTFCIELLPARHGDCIFIEYGAGTSLARLLIDGGPSPTYDVLRDRLMTGRTSERPLELVVVSHVDADHIEGLLRLFREPQLASYEDVWFNGWPQLDRGLIEPLDKSGDERRRSVGQGQALGRLLAGHPWNRYFGGDAVFVPAKGALPHVVLPGGMQLTLLSPSLLDLVKLQKTWDRWRTRHETSPTLKRTRRAGEGQSAATTSARLLDILQDVPGELNAPDDAVANGSSIAFIAEYAGKRCAFLADAHMPTVERSLRRFRNERDEKRLRLDVIKLSHHGSDGNITQSFLESVWCDNYLISTDGSKFRHPDDKAVKMVTRYSPGARLFFNYRSPQTAIWDEPGLRRDLGHIPHYPRESKTGIVFDVISNSQV
jgi:hypothetical protein